MLSLLLLSIAFLRLPAAILAPALLRVLRTAIVAVCIGPTLLPAAILLLALTIVALVALRSIRVAASPAIVTPHRASALAAVLVAETASARESGAAVERPTEADARQDFTAGYEDPTAEGIDPEAPAEGVANDADLFDRSGGGVCEAGHRKGGGTRGGQAGQCQHCGRCGELELMHF